MDVPIALVLFGWLSFPNTLLATGEPEVNIGVSNMYLETAILVISVGMVAFFSSAEASLISVNKFRIRYLAQQGNRSARTVIKALDHHEKFFATILLTENAFIIFASSVGTAMAIHIADGEGGLVLLAPFIMTIVVVIFGEITPKTLAASFSERWSLIIARPIAIVMFLETFIIYLFTLLPRLILAITKKNDHVTPSVTEGELRMLIGIGKAEGVVEANEAAMLEKVFHFGDRQLREIMTPRPEIIWIEEGISLEKFLEIYSRNTHTRFPVYEQTTENVIGVLSAKDVLMSLGKGELKRGDSVTGKLRPAYFVPETKTAGATFAEMQQGGYGLTLTVDEYGGIAGLVTLKQLIGVIVGEMDEEGISSPALVAPVDENTFWMDAGANVAQINEELHLGLPEGDYQTVAGFILDRLGRIPNKGDVVEYGNLKLTVKVMEGVRIEEVELRRVMKNPDEVAR